MVAKPRCGLVGSERGDLVGFKLISAAPESLRTGTGTGIGRTLRLVTVHNTSKPSCSTRASTDDVVPIPFSIEGGITPAANGTAIVEMRRPLFVSSNTIGKEWEPPDGSAWAASRSSNTASGLPAAFEVHSKLPEASPIASIPPCGLIRYRRSAARSTATPGDISKEPFPPMLLSAAEAVAVEKRAVPNRAIARNRADPHESRRHNPEDEPMMLANGNNLYLWRADAVLRCSQPITLALCIRRSL